ncbi:MobC family plasmid mobilization relaxosome protein [Psychrobacter sp. 16-MNA-CIBAN-0192]|uniref:MobC family plasmid mobilization relaxosome protein n=1 Tax=Psychrobacter sp. 16-MNA-CIBAN-0192 TaxID=3140448 RepID=UPI00331DBC9D
MNNQKPSKRLREISIRLTDDELQRLHQRKTDATLAGWMRNLCLGATPIKQADPTLVRALGRIGSNLNQIAKHANTHNQLDQNVLTEISAIREILTDLIEKNLQGED